MQKNAHSRELSDLMCALGASLAIPSRCLECNPSLQDFRAYLCSLRVLVISRSAFAPATSRINHFLLHSCILEGVPLRSMGQFDRCIGQLTEVTDHPRNTCFASCALRVHAGSRRITNDHCFYRPHDHKEELALRAADTWWT